MNILVLNAGSSSLKYKLIAIDNGREETLEDSEVESESGDFGRAAEEAVARCRPRGMDAVSHRVVHGGSKFREPARVTPAMLDDLKSLRELDPLHNPSEVGIIETVQRLLPGTPAVAVFDTAFHATLPEVAWRYALPLAMSDAFGLRRYGFHGISYQYVTRRLIERLGHANSGARLVICHLGNGASVCAVKDGQSVDTSMGLTPLEGLVMGTRSGDVDPGLILYLLREKKASLEGLDDALNKQSGLKGLSGETGDVRKLEETAARGDERSRIALEVFAYRVRKYIGAYAAALGGIDALAFTGGIGQHSPATRKRICAGLEFLGIALDEQANSAASGHDEAIISRSGLAAPVWLIPTNEELEIARQALEVLRH